MAIKRQVIEFTVTYDSDETYAESAVDAIEHEMFNIEGIIEWDVNVKSETVNEEQKIGDCGVCEVEDVLVEASDYHVAFVCMKCGAI